MQIGFHHIALTVKDIDRSADFYEKLGMEQVANYEHDDGSFKIAQLKFGSAILELFWFKNAEALPDKAQELKTDLRVIGTKHFGLKVESLDDALAYFRKLDIRPASEPRVGRTGVRYFFFKDPDGILVEVSQDDRTFMNSDHTTKPTI